VPGDGDAPVGQVEVIQRELPDRSRAGGVDRRQGDDQALRRADGHRSTARISAAVIWRGNPQKKAVIWRGNPQKNRSASAQLELRSRLR